jgi:Uma2 family endonuclease
LALQIRSAIREAKAPFTVAEAANVRTDDQLFIPDIVVADRAAVRKDPVAIPMEDVLLVVEIVSPGNAQVDRNLKPRAYAALGLENFWRLERAKGRPELVVHQLVGGAYQEMVRVPSIATVPVSGHFTVELDVPALFDLD